MCTEFYPSLSLEFYVTGFPTGGGGGVDFTLSHCLLSRSEESESHRRLLHISLRSLDLGIKQERWSRVSPASDLFSRVFLIAWVYLHPFLSKRGEEKKTRTRRVFPTCVPDRRFVSLRAAVSLVTSGTRKKGHTSQALRHCLCLDLPLPCSQRVWHRGPTDLRGSERKAERQKHSTSRISVGCSFLSCHSLLPVFFGTASFPLKASHARRKERKANTALQLLLSRIS